MAEAWVVNSSPLIVLGKAGALALLPELAKRLTVPAAVALEIQNGPPADAAGLWLSGSGAAAAAPLRCLANSAGRMKTV